MPAGVIEPREANIIGSWGLLTAVSCRTCEEIMYLLSAVLFLLTVPSPDWKGCFDCGIFFAVDSELYGISSLSDLIIYDFL